MATTAVKDRKDKAKAGPRPDGKPDRVYLVDGSGYIFRAFFAMMRTPQRLTRSDGTPIGAVLSFTQMLMRLVEDHDAEYIAVIFDASEETFRNEIYSDYKANRDAPQDELIPQFPLMREAVEAMSLPCIEKAG
jgi:DNA polymerase-1